MTTEITITDADNGIMIETEESVRVIENTHTGSVADKDNVIRELGKIFHGEIMETMNNELSGKIKVNIEISKAE